MRHIQGERENCVEMSAERGGRLSLDTYVRVSLRFVRLRIWQRENRNKAAGERGCKRMHVLIGLQQQNFLVYTEWQW